MLPLICSMSLISPNFAVKSIIFSPILARGLFPKLLEKSPVSSILLGHVMTIFLNCLKF